MAQIFAVHLQNLLVVDEHIAHFAHFLSVRGGYGANPGRRFALLDLRHFHAVGIVGNHFLTLTVDVSGKKLSHILSEVHQFAHQRRADGLETRLGEEQQRLNVAQAAVDVGLFALVFKVFC